VLDLARGAQRVTVLTGAGMSAESGVPTFRDAQTGLWARDDATELATPEAFHRRPAHVWGWYLWRLCRLSEVEPNAGHHALARWARRAEVRIVTQNVDDLHERAGSEVLAHLHGSLRDFRCSVCGEPYAGPLPSEGSAAGAAGAEVDPPACAACGGAVRPGVVWFGEPLPAEPFQAAVDACRNADLVVSVGTSGLVQPAAVLPDLAAMNRVPVLEVNPQDTEHSWGATRVWRTTAAVGLPALVDALEG
jgi:NAD-dependent deacetylase